MKDRFYFEFTETELDYIVNGLQASMECNLKAEELVSSASAKKAISEENKAIYELMKKITSKNENR